MVMISGCLHLTADQVSGWRAGSRGVISANLKKIVFSRSTQAGNPIQIFLVSVNAIRPPKSFSYLCKGRLCVGERDYSKYLFTV